MASLKSRLPPSKSTTTTTSFYDHSNAPWFKNRFTESESSVASKAVPPYLKRQGYPEDFGDGGAFPEIHVVQYPLGMGKTKSSFFCPQPNNNNKSNKHELHTTREETKAAMDKIVNVRLLGAQGSKYINYEPSQQSYSVAKERIIKMVETPVDPLVPPKFRHKRIPKPSSDSPPVTVMHSPPRPVTVKDQRDWKIPPCISNWKNSKGYVIPLEKRLAADGRGLREVEISDGFAKLSEAMDVAEEKAREAVSMRGKVRKEMVVMEKERREEELRGLAEKARFEGSGGRESESVEEREERMQRERVREERKRERRVEGMGKKRRDRERDVSERVALGMASTGGKVVYDQRLFNQEKGMDSGFASDDQYNVYEKGLFTARPTLLMTCKPRKDRDEEMYGNADEELDKLKNAERFKPDKGFTGGASERSGKRERPVEFEKEDAQDVFGLGQFMSDVNRGKKKGLDKIGSGGTMRASGCGSSSRDDYGGSGRTKIIFDRGGR